MSNGRDEWACPADKATVERTAAALRSKGYDVFVADDVATARQIVLEKLPKGAEVSQGASMTLEETGITALIEESGDYDAIRPRTRTLDVSTEDGRRLRRKMSGAPDWWINSAHAVTEDGRIVLASYTGSQLGPIAVGAGHVIFVIGAQKLVEDLEAALRRIEEHALPLESQRSMRLYGTTSGISKVLIINQEIQPGRFTVVIIRQAVGF
jgi:hypothetical protein